jgi:chloramphenicol O-acetyltransferase type A
MEHFNFFHGMDYPHFNICANIDVTHFRKFVKTKRISFYYAMIYASAYAANEMIDFRYRIRENQVVLHDKVHPSFTDLDDDATDLFKLVTVEMQDDLLEFVKFAEAKSKNQEGYFDLKQQLGRDDLLYITCVPWISFTHISHTISLNKNDSVPRISWGKYFSNNHQILLPFSVQVNHALMDGVHVGRYLSYLQSYIDNL